MIYKNNKTINEWYFNDAELIKVYKNGAICYYKIVDGNTPSQEPCFAVVNDITQYSDTEFIDVYDKATDKWYKLNNLDQYEEYGVYGSGRTITYYEGKLTIDNGYEYEWDGSQWDNLGEVSGSSVPDSYVIPFADSTVKNICVSNWGGNVVAGEITYGEAKQVTSLGSVFQRQTTITSFNELAYFHGLTSLDNGEFVGCTSLRDIVIPSNVTRIGYNNAARPTFSGCTNLSGLTILSGDETLTMDLFSNNNSYYMNSSHSNIPMCFPDRIMTFGTGTFGYCDYLTQAYFQNATPPVGLANADINNYRKLVNVYCPVGSLSAYQTALSGKGKTITEYDFETDSLGLLDKEKEWKAKTSSVIVYPKYYTQKQEPENNVVFEDMEEALAYECPWVGMDVTIDNTPYLFGDAYEWLTKYGFFEVSGEYMCYNGDKYEKMEEMVRNTDGTWAHQIPIVYERGDLIEAGSTDCQTIDYSTEYLTFVAETDNVSFQLVGGVNGNTFQYSIDGGSTWNNVSIGQTTSSINTGDKIMFKASSLSIGTETGIGTIRPSGSASVEGNIMSLVYGDNFSGQTSITNNFQLRKLFSGSTNITSAENMVLPATTFTKQCYSQMFQGCTNLVTPPKVVGTATATLNGDYCFSDMFANCSSMTTAPELPMTTLGTQCYWYMMQGCTSLTEAPVLPALTINTQSYAGMFNGCTSLNSITCLATAGISTKNCNNWVTNVSSSGTFTKAANASWGRGTSAAPSNWTIVNYSG